MCEIETALKSTFQDMQVNGIPGTWNNVGKDGDSDMTMESCVFEAKGLIMGRTTGGTRELPE